METLRDKTLIMIVGPSAIGKSTLMNEVVSQNSDFSYVRSFTTRSKRPGEESHYQFIDRETALALRSSGRTVTYFEHPTTSDLYGTTSESFPAQYNLLDALSSSVHSYRNLPFNQTITVSLAAQTSEWQQWFLARYPNPSNEALQRLNEAKLSIEWSLNDPETYWLVNQADGIEQTATKLISMVTNQSSQQQVPDEPRQILELIEKGIWP